MRDVKTPEEIVQMIGNIGNRPDIREVQERQAKEIREYVAKLFEEEAQRAYDHIDYPFSEEDIVCNNMLYAFSKLLKEKASLIREGKA